jgi:hypothetical protein
MSWDVGLVPTLLLSLLDRSYFAASLLAPLCLCTLLRSSRQLVLSTHISPFQISTSQNRSHRLGGHEELALLSLLITHDIVEHVDSGRLEPLEVHAVVHMVKTVVVAPRYLVALHSSIGHVVSLSFSLVHQLLDPSRVGVVSNGEEGSCRHGRRH